MEDKQSYVGKTIELDGIKVGLVVGETKNTLLVRRGFSSMEENEPIMLLEQNAMYLDKSYVLNAYWIRLVPTTEVTKTVNIAYSPQLIHEFFNV